MRHLCNEYLQTICKECVCVHGCACVSNTTTEGRKCSYLDDFMKACWDMGCILWRWLLRNSPSCLAAYQTHGFRDRRRPFFIAYFKWVLKRLIWILAYSTFRLLFSMHSHSSEMRTTVYNLKKKGFCNQITQTDSRKCTKKCVAATISWVFTLD